MSTDNPEVTPHGAWQRRRRDGEVYQATRRAIELGQKIYDVRTAQGLSQKALAEKAGVRQATISRIEQADAQPTIETLDRLAHALGLDLNVSLTERPLADV